MPLNTLRHAPLSGYVCIFLFRRTRIHTPIYSPCLLTWLALSHRQSMSCSPKCRLRNWLYICICMYVYTFMYIVYHISTYTNTLTYTGNPCPTHATAACIIDAKMYVLPGPLPLTWMRVYIIYICLDTTHTHHTRIHTHTHTHTSSRASNLTHHNITIL